MSESDGPHGRPLPFRSLPLAQREVALLILLCVISAATFAGTRRLAGWSRARRAEAAAQWFARGQTLAASGDVAGGIAAFREAVAADRQNQQYLLALAHSLADDDGADEARQILVQLRQTEPDEVEVNYRLARLAAASGDVDEAVRYYNFAMYGLAGTGPEYDRSKIRAELIGFLLDQGRRQEAITELGALSRQLPDDAAAQLEAARLADRAGDSRLALDRYTAAERLDPGNAAAAAGAGQAAFILHDYASAATELDRARSLGAARPDLEADAEIAQLVVANDPLGAKLRTAERAARLFDGLTHAAERYRTCGASAPAASPGAADPIQSGLADLLRRPRSALGDQDVLAHGVGVIASVEAAIRTRCPQSVQPIDRAWDAIAALHPNGGA